MKSNLFFGLILLTAFFTICEKTNSQSPDWLWAKSIGGQESDDARSIAVDPESGDVFTTGVFTGTVDFDPGGKTFNLTSSGTSDIFITKLDHSGHFVWAIAIGGPDIAYVASISLDPAGSGEMYLTGSFQGTVDFNPGEETFNLTSTGTPDMFVTKLDGSGHFIWAKAMGGTDPIYVLSMAVEPAGSGEVYTTGYFYGTIDFDPGDGDFSLTSKGDADIFISKLDVSGNFVWAVGLGGKGSDVSRSIALDPSGSGDVYTTGWFKGTADFDPGPNVYDITSVGRFDIFISKINTSGNFKWVKQLGGTGENDGSGCSIAIDPRSGDIYTTGYFEGTADFDPGKGIVNLVSSGSRDIFISKLDSSGDFVWAKAMGGTGIDIGSSIVVDPSQNGDVYILGNYHPSADFDPGPEIFNVTSAGSFDIFISKLDGSGNFVWAKAIGGTKGQTAGSLALDASGHAYVTGFFNGPYITFGPTALINAGDYDVFVAKLDVTKIVSVANIIKPQPIRLYPNPASDELMIEFEGDDFSSIGITMLSNSGEVVFSCTESIPFRKKTIDISRLTAGIYFIEAIVGGERMVKKIVKE